MGYQGQAAKERQVKSALKPDSRAKSILDFGGDFVVSRPNGF